MKIIVGVEGNRKPVLRRARALHAPVMASANSLWDARSGKFSKSWRELRGLEVFLDSGGFTAMKIHGGYRFSIASYARLAAEMRPAWWAAMDFCCEPEIAKDRRAVWDRVNASAAYFGACWKAASDLGAEPPMPVLAGWEKHDYWRAFGEYHRNVHHSLWPEVIGIGAMCRRHLHGPDGVLEILRYLDARLPKRFKFHLFGVKGAAAIALRGHPRIASVDSMAWSARARVVAREAGKPCDNALRAEFMERWLRKHREAIRERHEEMLLPLEKSPDAGIHTSFSSS